MRIWLAQPQGSVLCILMWLFIPSNWWHEVETLEPGAGTYAALLDRKGHMQGDMRVLRVAPDVLWIDLELEAKRAGRLPVIIYEGVQNTELAQVADVDAGRTIPHDRAAEELRRKWGVGGVG